MDKINTLQVIAGENVGGGERHLLLLADGLDKNRFKVLFASTRQEIFLKELKRRDLEVLLVNMDRKFNPMALWKIKNFILKKKIKIVHTHGARAGFYGRIAARLAGAPVIISTVHNSLYDYPISRIKKIIYIFLDKLTSRFCNKIICVSNAIASDLVTKTKISARKVLTIHNGIDVERFKQIGDNSYLLEEFNIGLQDKKIGIIARLTPQKGHIYLLNAMAKLISIFPGLKCLIVGEGYLKDELKELASTLGVLANCIFTGNRNDIPQLLSLLDVLILSSVSEGFPMILLEAMAASRPIVATAVSGVTELIENGANGLLVPPRDHDSLAQAITTLLTDNGKARQLSSAGQRLVEEKFNTGKMVCEIEELYRRLIEEHSNVKA